MELRPQLDGRLTPSWTSVVHALQDGVDLVCTLLDDALQALGELGHAGQSLLQLGRQRVRLERRDAGDAIPLSAYSTTGRLRSVHSRMPIVSLWWGRRIWTPAAANALM